MKQLTKLAALALLLALLATASTAFAGSPAGQGPAGGPGGPGGPGVRGEVTAIGTNSLTVLTAESKSVAVVTSDSTTVKILATGAAGSLSDIAVGTEVEVRGPRNADGSVTAESITILPDGDSLGGRVTAINGLTITVQTPGDKTATIVTTAATTFRKGSATASLSDAKVGQDVRAYGTLASDGSLTAALVLIQDAPAGGPGGPGGRGGGPGNPGGPGGSAGGGPGGRH